STVKSHPIPMAIGIRGNPDPEGPGDLNPFSWEVAVRRSGDPRSPSQSQRFGGPGLVPGPPEVKHAGPAGPTFTGLSLLAELPAAPEQDRAPLLLARAAQELDIDEWVATRAAQRRLLGEGDGLSFGNQHDVDGHVGRRHVREVCVV